MRPSMPSSTPAMMMAPVADSNFPLSARRIAVMPAQSASSVKMLGIIRLSDRLAIGRTRTRGRRSIGGLLMRKSTARRLLRAGVGDDGLAADDALAGNDEAGPAEGKIEVGAAAEADEAEALPRHHLLSRGRGADDASRDQAGDL